MTTDIPRHADGATVIMSVQTANKPAAQKPEAPARILYVVRPVDERWEVTFGDSGETKLFDVKQDAILAARSAAREQWTERNQPSRVTLELGGTPQMVALYGMELPS